MLGQRLVEAAVPALTRALLDVDEDATVRAAAAWALGRIATESAIEALRQVGNPPDAMVRDAVTSVLAGSRFKRETRQPG